MLKFEHDEFADLNLRTTAGPSVGYQFFESRPLNLKAEAGVILANANYSTESDSNYWGAGWHISFDKYIVSDHLQLYHEQFGLLGTEDTDNLLWKFWTGLRVPLFGGFVVSGEARFSYDSDPAEDTETTQETYRLKLGYAW